MKFFLVALFSFFTLVVFSQPVFIEEEAWFKKKENLIKGRETLTIKVSPADYKRKDTVLVMFLYPNNKVAMEGKCKVSEDTSLVVFDTWNIFYTNGKFWSKRSYNELGKLMNIDTLLSPLGKDLMKGYARPAHKKGMISGYNYIYNKTGKIESICRYSNGILKELVSPESLNEEQKKRLVVRKFITSEGMSIEEYSLEEAWSKHLIDPKPILLNVSASWNGYTKKGYDQLYADPEIASFLNKHFYLAYSDMEDSKSIELMVDGKIKEFKGFGKGLGQPEAITAIYGKGVMATPVFIFIENGKMVYHYVGIELEKPKFMKILEFYTSGDYKSKDWNEFKKSLESKK